MKNMKPNLGNPPIFYIPSVILSVIFSLLPTKSILSCKFVCKLWCSIIRNPDFSMSSKSITLFVRSLRHRKNLHLVEPHVDYAFVGENYWDLSLVLGEKSVIKFNNASFGCYGVEEFHIVNSCKGLVCFAIGSFGCFIGLTDDSDNIDVLYVVFAVCNPVTSDYVVIERPMSIERLCRCEQKHTGFGFSSKSNQYKLISFFSDRKKSNDEGPLGAEVYDFGSDEKWREVENRPPQGYSWSGNATFCEGSLHWIVVHCRTSIGRIAAFDCHEESFVLVDLPCGLVNDVLTTYKAMMDLSILQSRLCFSVWNAGVKNTCDIWVMNEYGVKESWKKLFVVSICDGPSCHLPFKPLAYLNNGEILMLSVFSELVCYNVGSNTWRDVEMFGVDGKVEPMLFDPIFLPIKNLLICGEQSETTVTGTA